jgi:hypothetical protein
MEINFYRKNTWVEYYKLNAFSYELGPELRDTKHPPYSISNTPVLLYNIVVGKATRIMKLLTETWKKNLQNY